MAGVDARHPPKCAGRPCGRSGFHKSWDNVESARALFDWRFVMSESDDFVAILNVAYRYAQAADRRDWRGLADCYSEDAIVNFNGTIVEGRDAIIARNRVQLTKWEATQHFTGNPVIRIDGDRADASFYTIAQHTVIREGSPVTCLAGGVYEDELIRTAEGWRFRRRRIQKLWMMGDESLLPAAIYGGASPPELKPLEW